MTYCPLDITISELVVAIVVLLVFVVLVFVGIVVVYIFYISSINSFVLLHFVLFYALFCIWKIQSGSGFVFCNVVLTCVALEIKYDIFVFVRLF